MGFRGQHPWQLTLGPKGGKARAPLSAFLAETKQLGKVLALELAIPRT